MVFCCIAIVGIAIIYFIMLWIRQIFSWPKRDKGSNLPAPPRALTGHKARPVYGHTALFVDRAGDCATLFHPEDRSIMWLPAGWSKTLGDCFAMFFWGQWRVVVKGPARAEYVLKSQELKESWPWSPPTTLLGKSCFAFLEEDESEHLRRLLGRPLSHRQVLLYAPQFAKQAEKCLAQICAGTFRKKPESNERRPFDDERRANLDDSMHGGVTNSVRDVGSSLDGDDTTLTDAVFKVKWDAFRSYTFDLVDGPVLGLNLWNSSESPNLECGTAKRKSKKKTKDGEMPCRETMILYMERIKRGVDVIKTTFGPEWMYIWMLNEYGRALNARMHVEEVVRKHVSDVAKRDPGVKHKIGHAYQDPTTQPIPFLTMHENFMRTKEGIFGDSHVQPKFSAGRPRSHSMPGVSSFKEIKDSGWTSSDDEPINYDLGVDDFLSCFATPQDSLRPRAVSVDVSDLASAKARLCTPNSSTTTSTTLEHETTIIESTAIPNTSPSLNGPAREWRKSMQEQLANMDNPITNKTRVAASPLPDPEIPILQSKRVTIDEKRGISMLTVLERLMKQHDMDGNGLSQVVTSDIAIILWMMLEVGNAWTAMALSLIAADAETLALVQQELDDLERSYGKGDLFSPSALGRMKYLDALLHEAIRLCPPNLGGMKKTTETIELKDIGVQIPKDTNIFFCRPHDMKFDIHSAVGKKPENLGRLYPCVELHGFMPLQGMEVPLMVLQSKVFLICMMQKFTPVVSKKITFIRRVRTRVKGVSQSIIHNPVVDTFRQSPMVNSFRRSSHCNLGASSSKKSSQQSTRSKDFDESPSPSDDLEAQVACEDTPWEVPPQPDFMAHFTKTPFPEPRRVINIRPRILDFQSESVAI